MNFKKLSSVCFLLFGFQSRAGIYTGQVKEAVGLAARLSGGACELEILRKNSDKLNAVLTVTTKSQGASQRFYVELNKEDRYLLEKIQSFDYGQHQVFVGKSFQTQISSLLKFDDKRFIFSQEYSRNDISSFYFEGDYYRFTCEFKK